MTRFLLKHFQALKRPEGLDPANYRILKYQLIKEVKELVCSKLTEQEFKSPSQNVLELIMKANFKQLVRVWEAYQKDSHRWAPYCRERSVREIFGDSNIMPMLSRSNNSLERFFGVLKHCLLEGQNSRTFSNFLQIWMLH